MKKLIKEVLDDLKYSQVNLESKSSREMIANLISVVLKAKGSYKEYTDYEFDEQKAIASWVCKICGKSTYEVEYDYIGSGANHLSCELKSQKEIDEYAEDIDDQAHAQGRGSSKDVRREKNWLQKKHEDKVFDEVSSADYHTGPDGHYKKEKNNNTKK